MDLAGCAAGKASKVVPYEDAAASAKEIELRAGDKNFAQVLMLRRTAEHARRPALHWPIYAAAEAAGLPIGIHAFGYGGFPITAGGWPSYYIEEMVGHAQCSQSVVASMILEGVFERFPRLKIVLIEGGVAWAAALGWRMDAQWKKLKQELPHLQRLPSGPLCAAMSGSAPSRSRSRSRAAMLAETFDRDRLGPHSVRVGLPAPGFPTTRRTRCRSR